MGYKLFLLVAFIASCSATKYDDAESYEDQKEDYQYPPLPYNFGYSSDDGYGSTQYRSETGNGEGKVEGRYGYKDANGVERVVEYVADENGYRAQIKTNEPGTENKSPAGVDLYADPIEIPYEPQVQTYAQGYAAEQYGAQQYASAPTKKQESQKFSATRFQSLSAQKSEEYTTTPEQEKYTAPKQLIQQFSAAKKQPAQFFAIQRPQQFVAVRQPQAVLVSPQPRPFLAAPLPGPVLAAPLPQPVLAAPLQRGVFAAPHPHPVLAAVPHPQPAFAAVPHPQPVFAAVPNPQPAFAAVPHPQPAFAAVPHPHPILAAVPHPQPAFAAVPHPQPVLAAVPHPQPVLAAVPHPQPVLAAVPHPQPVLAAVPHPQPILAAHGQPIQHFAFQQRHFQATPSILQHVHHTSSNTKTQPQHYQVQATHQFFNIGNQRQY